MNLAGHILGWFGWKVRVNVPDYDKCIIAVAPHTSNWDYVLCQLAYATVGRHAGFLMKKSWFFFPMGLIFKSVGGIPVERKNKKVSLTEVVTEKFKNSDKLVIAITPEGTRSRVAKWHSGFLHIAYNAHVPIDLAVIDAGTKSIFIDKVFIPTGDFEADMRHIKDYYSQFTAIYPEKFTTDDE